MHVDLYDGHKWLLLLCCITMTPFPLCKPLSQSCLLSSHAHCGPVPSVCWYRMTLAGRLKAAGNEEDGEASVPHDNPLDGSGAKLLVLYVSYAFWHTWPDLISIVFRISHNW